MTMMRRQQTPRPDRMGSNDAERIRDEDYTLPIEKMRLIIREIRGRPVSYFSLVNFYLCFLGIYGRGWY
jgi:hypothetical protein